MYTYICIYRETNIDTYSNSHRHNNSPDMNGNNTNANSKNNNITTVTIHIVIRMMVATMITKLVIVT